MRRKARGMKKSGVKICTGECDGGDSDGNHGVDDGVSGGCDF